MVDYIISKLKEKGWTSKFKPDPERDYSYLQKYDELGWVIFPIANAGKRRFPIKTFVKEMQELKTISYPRLTASDYGNFVWDWFDPKIEAVGLSCGPYKGTCPCGRKACSSGVMALDCDRLKPKDDDEVLQDGVEAVYSFLKREKSLTKKEFKEWISSGDVPCIQTISRSGGRHLIFGWDDSFSQMDFALKSDTNRKAKVEIKAQHSQLTLPLDPDSNSKFVRGCAPWEKVKLKARTPLPTIKSSFPELYNKLWKNNEVTTLIPMVEEISSERDPPSLEMAIEAAEMVPQSIIDIRSKWIQMGQGIARTFGHKGVKVWNVLCERFSGEHTEDNEKTYDEFVEKAQKPTGKKKPASIASLFYHLKENLPEDWEELVKRHFPHKVKRTYAHQANIILQDPECINSESLALLFEGSQLDQARVVKNLLNGRLFYMDVQKALYYQWQNTQKIWEMKKDKDMASTYICEMLDDYIRPLIEEAKGKKLTELADKRKYIMDETTQRKIMVKLKSMIHHNDLLGKLNTFPSLFPIANGRVVDLVTGKVRERKRSDFFSFESSYEPGDPENEDVLEYMRSMFHEEELEYVQCLFGLVMTGEPYKAAWVWKGDTGIGKSVLINFIKAILGDLQTPAPRNALMKSPFDKGSGGPNPELVAMVGKRAVFFAEIGSTNRLDDLTFKMITGDDSSLMRDLYCGYVPYKSLPIKFFFVGNESLTFDTQDKAAVGRIVYISGTNTVFELNDPETGLPRKLKKSEKKYLLECHARVSRLQTYEGHCNLMAWMVEGAKKFYANGKKLPSVPETWVTKKTKEIKTIDTIAQFMRKGDLVFDCEDETIQKASRLVYEAYTRFSRSRDMVPVSEVVFSKALASKGFKKKKTKKCNAWLGVCDRDDDDE